MNNPANTPAQPAQNAFKEYAPPVTPEAEKVITVKVKADAMIDEKLHKAGTTHKITVKQWRCLSRLFEWVDGPIEHHPETYHAPAKPVL